MADDIKKQIGRRVREKREQAGYTREKLGELCSLSPRFIANVELGDSMFSLNTLMTICHVLACSSDYLLFGNSISSDSWSETIAKLQQLDLKYQEPVNAAIQNIVEAIVIAESQS